LYACKVPIFKSSIGRKTCCFIIIFGGKLVRLGGVALYLDPIVRKIQKKYLAVIRKWRRGGEIIVEKKYKDMLCVRKRLSLYEDMATLSLYSLNR
jgi:hypothetical protein